MGGPAMVIADGAKADYVLVMQKAPIRAKVHGAITASVAAGQRRSIASFIRIRTRSRSD
jgi:hypothetical protein